MNFTIEAQIEWDKLTEEQKSLATENHACQKCKAPIPPDEFNVSIYEGELAFFHHCKHCQNKEVRLVDPEEKHQKEVDDDFAQWLKAKKKAHPDKF